MFPASSATNEGHGFLCVLLRLDGAAGDTRGSSRVASVALVRNGLAALGWHLRPRCNDCTTVSDDSRAQWSAGVEFLFVPEIYLSVLGKCSTI